MLGELQQLFSNSIVDTDGSHRLRLVCHFGIDSGQRGFEEREDCQRPVDVAGEGLEVF